MPRVKSEAAPGKGKIRCLNCGATIWAGHHQCPQCGQNPRSAPAIEPVPAEPAAGNGAVFNSSEQFRAVAVFALRVGGIHEARKVLAALEEVVNSSTALHA